MISENLLLAFVRPGIAEAVPVCLCGVEIMSDSNRYDKPEGWFRRCGKSGLQLPAISLGFWHNFGAPGTASHGATDEEDFHDRARALMFEAFDLGITHFDFANNYGPPPGAAEERCGRILKDLPRNELVISSKAGFRMWPGPYGDGGSRKYLIESCDESLRRLQLDHLDIFFHHRPDPGTPLEETLEALDYIVRSGRAHYAGISNYPGARAEEVFRLCRDHRWVRPMIHQPRYNMLDRKIESDLLPVAEREGFGVIVFSPLAQGLLTGKYLEGIPDDSRAATPSGFLEADQISEARIALLRKLNDLAEARGQTLAQMAITWILRNRTITSALVGASRPEQIRELVAGAEASALTDEELAKIGGMIAEA